jgi:hypothetical protein
MNSPRNNDPTILALAELNPEFPLFSDKHRILVRILLRKYKGSFNALKFGENKPLMGSCHDGQLDLLYCRDPGLKEGQSFPLWRI